MTLHTEQSQGQELPREEVFSRISGLWKKIVSEPQEWMADMSAHSLAFTAGGGLPSRFGQADSEIWQAMLAAQQEGQVQVAGIQFSIPELELIGSFYRFLKAQGIAEHCIDERLIDDLENQKTEVHEECGACAAIASSAAIPTNVEDLLLQELGQENFGKQPISPDMHHEHTSLAILVDFHGADIVKEEKREEVRAAKALPFNVSLPLEKIAAWAQEQRESEAYQANNQESLLLALAKWNVRIARNIIGGGHNSLGDLAQRTLLIIDRRGVDGHSLAQQMLQALTEALEGAAYEHMLFVGEPSMQQIPD